MPSDTGDAGDGYEPLSVPVGDATVRLEIDQPTYELLREAYRRHAEARRAHGREPVQWDTYVHNNCMTDYVVEVGGEVVDDPLQEADGDD